jgi:hypothetical protein
MSIPEIAAIVIGLGAATVALIVSLRAGKITVGPFAFLLVAIVAVSLSSWGSIKISALGAELELARKQLQEVATETVVAAEALETARVQLDSLTVTLERSHTLNAAAANKLRAQLRTMPRINTSRLQNVVAGPRTSPVRR